VRIAQIGEITARPHLISSPQLMPIPDFQSCMLPVLRDLAGGPRSGHETVEAIGTEFSLTPDELAERLPSGRQSTLTNRVAWAKSHLKGAGLVDSPRRGVHQLTARGRSFLGEQPSVVNMKVLARFPEYLVFRAGSSEDAQPAAPSPVASPGPISDARTPDDLVVDGHAQLRRALAADLRERMAAMPPAAFEQLVVDLLRAMGYGGPQDEAALVVGRGGDEGIDGVIHEDRLGLETIYVQAKRWQSAVGRPEIQQFAGALQGQNARKGVFITTSSFSAAALDYARSLPTRIVLIGGTQLADLMIEHGVGVTTVTSYAVKRVDSDYFSDE